MADVDDPLRLERLTDIETTLAELSHRAGRCFLGSVLHEFLHVQIDAKLDEWQALRAT